MSRTGVLVVNLGSPDAPESGAVRRYLREFLGDPRVLDMNPVGRWLLLNLVILPLRPRRSAEAYAKVWTDQGSPLLVHGRALARGLAAALPGCEVALAMRYGQPSLKLALDRLRAAGCDELVVFPLYPQYAASTTGSTLEEVFRLVGSRWNVPSVLVVPPYYEHPDFIEAFARAGESTFAELDPDHVLFSFHGLPERHVQKSDEAGDHCLRSEACCARLGAANRNCYRAQCFATARALAERLSLEPEGYTVAFQSRLGRTPWIQPHTDETLRALRAAGKERVAVFCPAFTADCLETLEEIGIRARAAFEADGVGRLRLVPSLNATAPWVEAAARLIRASAGPRWLALPAPER